MSDQEVDIVPSRPAPDCPRGHGQMTFDSRREYARGYVRDYWTCRACNGSWMEMAREGVNDRG